MKQRTVNEYLKNRYGKKIYKIAINAGLTCPNRDGTLGTSGCIFCSGSGSGDFAEDPGISVTEQIERGKNRVKDKVPSDAGYIAYFQAYTNTYAPVEKLRKLYMEAVNHPDIVLISIATRPDCLGPEVLDLLSEINELKPVWVELGLQTIHERTAQYIRRGYPLPVYDRAVSDLKNAGIEVITHIVLGLPGETTDDMLSTVEYVGRSGVQGIKLQLLHVLKGTDLAVEYEEGKFECLTMDEYVQLIKASLDILPDDIIIHRMTGDGARRLLIAPLWSLDKKRVLNELNRRIIYDP